MESRVNVSLTEGETEYISHYRDAYRDAFPIPYPNIYGECNNFHSGRFMESQSTECAQVVNLSESCQTTLNPAYYTSRLQVYGGPGLLGGSVPVPVEVEEILEFKIDTSEYVDTLSTAIADSALDESVAN